MKWTLLNTPKTNLKPMGLKDIAARLEKLGHRRPVATDEVFRTGSCPIDVCQSIWQRYISLRSRGVVEPFWSSNRPHKTRMYHLGAQILKEYSCGAAGSARDMVEREVAILQQLHHENLVGCLFVADQGTKVSIVMDWAGDSLRTHRTLTQPKQYTEAVARHMVYQLTHALVYLHQKGIIHRDIKPDNIGVHVDHRVQLFDWGEAITLKQMDRLSDKVLSKQVGVAGTPLFMPPEVLNYLTDRDRDSQGVHDLRGIISTKLDVWGLGTVLFFLLAGRDIFINDSSWELENLADIANASCGVELPLGVEASYAARDFLRRCLERDPLERASAKELMQHPWLMGACSANDMEAFHAAQQRHNSSTVHRTALLSVLAESFSSEGDEGDDLQQPIALAPEDIAAATAAMGGTAATDALSASLALASGVCDAASEQEHLQLQSTHQLLQLARSLSHHRRLSSLGSKGHLAAMEADSDAALQLHRSSSGEAVCEVRLRLSPSGSVLGTAVH